MIKMEIMLRECSKQVSLHKKTHRDKEEKIKYIDISCGKEPIPINMIAKERTKLIKKFNYLSNYIVECQIQNKILDDYLLPKTSCCDCSPICSQSTCQCISNHAQIYECNEYCKCEENCSNRTIQNGINKKLLLKYINKNKGFGLFANENLKKGDFICEYIGSIISKDEAEKKIHLNHKKQKPNYILQIKESYSKVEINTYIDAEIYGNIGRFINHSCEPNLNFEFIRIKHYIPHVAFFANKDISKGEELTFMYCEYQNSVNEGLSYKKCECGAKTCKKFIPN